MFFKRIVNNYSLRWSNTTILVEIKRFTKFLPCFITCMFLEIEWRCMIYSNTYLLINSISRSPLFNPNDENSYHIFYFKLFIFCIANSFVSLLTILFIVLFIYVKKKQNDVKSVGNSFERKQKKSHGNNRLFFTNWVCIQIPWII